MLHDNPKLVANSQISREFFEEDRGLVFPETPTDGRVFQLTQTFGIYPPSIYVYSELRSDWVRQVEISNVPYDVGFSILSIPDADEDVGNILLSRSWLINTDFINSFARASVPATATTDYKIFKRVLDNHIEIGTINFLAGSSEGTFVPEVYGEVQLISAGDSIYIQAPSTIDSTLNGITLTISGELAVFGG